MVVVIDFNSLDILTTMFVFKSYDMLIGFILSKRKKEKIKIRTILWVRGIVEL